MARKSAAILRVFLAYDDSMLSPLSKSGTLSLSKGKKGHAVTTVFLNYRGNTVAACRPQSGTLSFFSALTLLVG